MSQSEPQTLIDVMSVTMEVQCWTVFGEDRTGAAGSSYSFVSLSSSVHRGSWPLGSWARIHCCKYKRLKWSPSGEWMVFASAMGLRSLDVGKEVDRTVALWQWKEPIEVVLMRMPPGLIPLEVFWRHCITCPTCHGSTSVPTEGSIARRRET